ncbi:MAG: DJ-1/PfpI family protein [Bryobacterales bacterium]|nr:DJ-1/PfpI family protein [Bryobacterales bacterium]
MTPTRQVAILIFPDVEVLDFAGPFEVFAVAGEMLNGSPYHTYTVGTGAQTLVARNGLKVVANYTLENAPLPDILVLPGGSGSRVASQESVYMDWIERAAGHATHVITVCTGARFTARLGWLNGQPYTTHHLAFDELRELVPDGELRAGQRFVETGKLISAAGISAGIDASLYLLAKLSGDDAAAIVARYMEYTPQR